MSETTTDPPVSAIMTISGDPIPLLNLEGHLVTFKDDPIADQAWADLVGLKTKLEGLDPGDGPAVKDAADDLKRILGEFVVDGKPEWEKSSALGFKNLANILTVYVEKVTEGIPT